MMINVAEFVKEFKEKNIVNSKINNHAVSDYLKEKLEIKTYIPFREKREIVEMIVAANTQEVDGIKKNDAIAQYVCFIIAMIQSHTNLVCGENPVDDYDLLAENGLLMPIIELFIADYNDCDVLLKMATSAALEDNNVNVFVGKFLNGLLNRIDGVGSSLKEMLGDIDLKNILGADFNSEDLAKLKGFLNTQK